jgi:hypothetical protein
LASNYLFCKVCVDEDYGERETLLDKVIELLEEEE